MPVALVLADADPARARAEAVLRAAPGEWSARHVRGPEELRPALAAGRCDVVVAADRRATVAHRAVKRIRPDLPFLFDAAAPAGPGRVALLAAGARDVDLGDAEAAAAVLQAVVGTAAARHRRGESRPSRTPRDSVTGLADGRAVGQQIDRAIARARRHALQVALVHVDVEGLDDADEGGTAAGQLARRVAGRMEEVVRATDVIGRESGGCFVVLLADVDGDASVATARVAGALRSRLGEPFGLHGREHRPAVRVGVACWPRDAAHGSGLAPAARAAAHGDDTASVTTLPSRTRAPAPAVERAERAALDRLLDDRAVTPVFQPIVDLDTGETVGYESLARGPRGTLLERPDRLFALARRVGRLDELDWLCRVSALRAAAAAGLRSPATLFVNVEPATLPTPCPPGLRDDWRRGAPGLGIVLEITERAVTARPAELLGVVAEVRRRGWGLALDDIGADTRSLALLPFVRPDVVKLDLRLLHEQTTAGTAGIVNAVGAHAERTGALVLAEGIETREQADLARAMGARLGQGWLFGHPGPLPSPPPTPARALPLAGAPEPPTGDTPYTVVASRRPARRADKGLLLTISRALESQAAGLGPTGVLMAAFQDVRRFGAASRAHYREMARRAALVAVCGVGMDAHPLRGVRGAALAADDALAGEWSVVVVGPHFAAALAAVDLGDDGPDEHRRFDFTMTYERDLVLAAAGTLLARVRDRPAGTSAVPGDAAPPAAAAQAGTRSARV